MSEPLFSWLAYMRSLDVDRRWCLVMTESGKERDVQAELAMAGWTTYQPMETKFCGNGERRRPRRFPLFARYLFAVVNHGGDPAASSEIKGVVRVGRPGAARSCIPCDLIAKLMFAEAAGALDQTIVKPKPAAGAFHPQQNVKITGGVLKGFEAQVLKVISSKEVVAAFLLFGQRGEAIFSTDHIEAADAA